MNYSFWDPLAQLHGPLGAPDTTLRITALRYVC